MTSNYLQQSCHTAMPWISQQHSTLPFSDKTNHDVEKQAPLKGCFQTPFHFLLIVISLQLY